MEVVTLDFSQLARCRVTDKRDDYVAFCKQLDHEFELGYALWSEVPSEYGRVPTPRPREAPATTYDGMVNWRVYTAQKQHIQQDRAETINMGPAWMRSSGKGLCLVICLAYPRGCGLATEATNHAIESNPGLSANGGSHYPSAAAVA